MALRPMKIEDDSQSPVKLEKRDPESLVSTIVTDKSIVIVSSSLGGKHPARTDDAVRSISPDTTESGSCDESRNVPGTAGNERKGTPSTPECSNLDLCCVECGRTFTEPSLLALHREKHARLKPFHCTQCRKSFTSYVILMEHLSLHSSQAHDTVGITNAESTEKRPTHPILNVPSVSSRCKTIQLSLSSPTASQHSFVSSSWDRMQPNRQLQTTYQSDIGSSSGGSVYAKDYSVSKCDQNNDTGTIHRGKTTNTSKKSQTQVDQALNLSFNPQCEGTLANSGQLRSEKHSSGNQSQQQNTNSTVACTIQHQRDLLSKKQSHDNSSSDSCNNANCVSTGDGSILASRSFKTKQSAEDQPVILDLNEKREINVDIDPKKDESSSQEMLRSPSWYPRSSSADVNESQVWEKTVEEEDGNIHVDSILDVTDQEKSQNIAEPASLRSVAEDNPTITSLLSKKRKSPNSGKKGSNKVHPEKCDKYSDSKSHTKTKGVCMEKNGAKQQQRDSSKAKDGDPLSESGTKSSSADDDIIEGSEEVDYEVWKLQCNANAVKQEKPDEVPVTAKDQGSATSEVVLVTSDESKSSPKHRSVERSVRGSDSKKVGDRTSNLSPRVKALDAKVKTKEKSSSQIRSHDHKSQAHKTCQNEFLNFVMNYKISETDSKNSEIETEENVAAADSADHVVSSSGDVNTVSCTGTGSDVANDKQRLVDERHILDKAGKKRLETDVQNHSSETEKRPLGKNSAQTNTPLESADPNISEKEQEEEKHFYGTGFVISEKMKARIAELKGKMQGSKEKNKKRRESKDVTSSDSASVSGISDTECRRMDTISITTDATSMVASIDSDVSGNMPVPSSTDKPKKTKKKKSEKHKDEPRKKKKKRKKCKACRKVGVKCIHIKKKKKKKKKLAAEQPAIPESTLNTSSSYIESDLTSEVSAILNSDATSVTDRSDIQVTDLSENETSSEIGSVGTKKGVSPILKKPKKKSSPREEVLTSGRVLRNREALPKPCYTDYEESFPRTPEPQARRTSPKCKLTRLPNGRLLREITGPIPMRSQLFFLKRDSKSTEGQETSECSGHDAAQEKPTDNNSTAQPKAYDTEANVDTEARKSTEDEIPPQNPDSLQADNTDAPSQVENSPAGFPTDNVTPGSVASSIHPEPPETNAECSNDTILNEESQSSVAAEEKEAVLQIDVTAYRKGNKSKAKSKKRFEWTDIQEAINIGKKKRKKQHHCDCVPATELANALEIMDLGEEDKSGQESQDEDGSTVVTEQSDDCSAETCELDNAGGDAEGQTESVPEQGVWQQGNTTIPPLQTIGGENIIQTPNQQLPFILNLPFQPHVLQNSLQPQVLQNSLQPQVLQNSLQYFVQAGQYPFADGPLTIPLATPLHLPISTANSSPLNTGFISQLPSFQVPLQTVQTLQQPLLQNYSIPQNVPLLQNLQIQHSLTNITNVISGTNNLPQQSTSQSIPFLQNIIQDSTPLIQAQPITLPQQLQDLTQSNSQITVQEPLGQPVQQPGLQQPGLQQSVLQQQQQTVQPAVQQTVQGTQNVQATQPNGQWALHPRPILPCPKKDSLDPWALYPKPILPAVPKETNDQTFTLMNPDTIQAPTFASLAATAQQPKDINTFTPEVVPESDSNQKKSNNDISEPEPKNQHIPEPKEPVPEGLEPSPAKDTGSSPEIEKISPPLTRSRRSCGLISKENKVKKDVASATKVKSDIKHTPVTGKQGEHDTNHKSESESDTQPESEVESISPPVTRSNRARKVEVLKQATEKAKRASSEETGKPLQSSHFTRSKGVVETKTITKCSQSRKQDSCKAPKKHVTSQENVNLKSKDHGSESKDLTPSTTRSRYATRHSRFRSSWPLSPSDFKQSKTPAKKVAKLTSKKEDSSFEPNTVDPDVSEDIPESDADEYEDNEMPDLCDGDGPMENEDPDLKTAVQAETLENVVQAVCQSEDLVPHADVCDNQDTENNISKGDKSENEICETVSVGKVVSVDKGSFPEAASEPVSAEDPEPIPTGSKMTDTDESTAVDQCDGTGNAADNSCDKNATELPTTDRDRNSSERADMNMTEKDTEVESPTRCSQPVLRQPGNSGVKLPRIPHDQLIGIAKRLYKPPGMTSKQKSELVKSVINEALEKVRNSFVPSADDGNSFEEELVRELNDGLNACKELHEGFASKSRHYPKLAISKDLYSLKILIFWESGKEPCIVTITQNQIPTYRPKAAVEDEPREVEQAETATHNANQSDGQFPHCETQNDSTQTHQSKSKASSKPLARRQPFTYKAKFIPRKGARTNLPSKFKVGSRGAMISVKTVRETTSLKSGNQSPELQSSNDVKTSPEPGKEAKEQLTTQVNLQEDSKAVKFKWADISFRGKTYNRKRKFEEVDKKHVEPDLKTAEAFEKAKNVGCTLPETHCQGEESPEKQSDLNDSHTPKELPEEDLVSKGEETCTLTAELCTETVKEEHDMVQSSSIVLGDENDHDTQILEENNDIIDAVIENEAEDPVMGGGEGDNHAEDIPEINSSNDLVPVHEVIFTNMDTVKDTESAHDTPEVSNPMKDTADEVMDTNDDSDTELAVPDCPDLCADSTTEKHYLSAADLLRHMQNSSRLLSCPQNFGDSQTNMLVEKLPSENAHLHVNQNPSLDSQMDISPSDSQAECLEFQDSQTESAEVTNMIDNANLDSFESLNTNSSEIQNSSEEDANVIRETLNSMLAEVERRISASDSLEHQAVTEVNTVQKLLTPVSVTIQEATATEIIDASFAEDGFDSTSVKNAVSQILEVLGDQECTTQQEPMSPEMSKPLLSPIKPCYVKLENMSLSQVKLEQEKVAKSGRSKSVDSLSDLNDNFSDQRCKVRDKQYKVVSVKKHSEKFSPRTGRSLRRRRSTDCILTIPKGMPEIKECFVKLQKIELAKNKPDLGDGQSNISPEPCQLVTQTQSKSDAIEFESTAKNSPDCPEAPNDPSLVLAEATVDGLAKPENQKDKECPATEVDKADTPKQLTEDKESSGQQTDLNQESLDKQDLENNKQILVQNSNHPGLKDSECPVDIVNKSEKVAHVAKTEKELCNTESESDESMPVDEIQTDLNESKSVAVMDSRVVMQDHDYFKTKCIGNQTPKSLRGSNVEEQRNNVNIKMKQDMEGGVHDDMNTIALKTSDSVLECEPKPCLLVSPDGNLQASDSEKTKKESTKSSDFTKTFQRRKDIEDTSDFASIGVIVKNICDSTPGGGAIDGDFESSSSMFIRNHRTKKHTLKRRLSQDSIVTDNYTDGTSARPAKKRRSSVDL